MAIVTSSGIVNWHTRVSSKTGVPNTEPLSKGGCRIFERGGGNFGLHANKGSSFGPNVKKLISGVDPGWFRPYAGNQSMF